MLSGLWLALAGPAVAQAPADSLDRIGRQVRRHEQRDPHEKLFLHLDRPVYLSGETMWFSVYAADGTTARPLPLSSVAYVEVLDTKHQPVLQGKVALREATGQGSFVLPAALPAGRYTVRAYTSWMRNFGPDTYFHTAVTVINTFTASGTAAKDSATADVQFFPEGGNLVRGLRSRVAFKVTDKAGRGVAATGKVLNQRGAVVATFQTLHRGMGSFAFTPAVGTDAYTAVVLLPNGQPVTRPLPRVFDQGYVLHLEQPDPAHLTLTVSANPATNATVYLLGHSRQQVAMAKRLILVNGQGTLAVDPSTLLDGVSHFTVFTGAQQPVCERLYFRAPQRTLAIAARADKPQYSAREKVQVQVSAADQQTPLAANLSMAVYRLDSLNTTPLPGIDRSLWLTSELAGTVEDPDYYFTANSPTALEATDNLLLTQGWSRFKWEDVLAATPKPMEFRPEPHGLVARAQLAQAGSGQPRPNVTTFLASPSLVTRLSNARSNDRGIVQFELADFSGPRDLVLQADPSQDSTSRLTLLDPFSARYASTAGPAVGVLPRFERDYTRRHLQAQVQQAFAGKYRSRFAVEPVDSLPFFGRPSESYLLDKFTRFKTMEEVMREYVPGVLVRISKGNYHLLVVDKVNKTVLENNPMVLLDGVPVFNMNKIMAINPLKIRKLEVVDSRYFHGSSMYDGIVNLSTYKGDLEGFELDPRVLVQQYEGVQRQREFYAPRYDTPQSTQSRLPDLRNLLYWNPAIRTTATGVVPLEFYTGDQAGRYLVVLQGLAANGLAGSHSFVLEVKPAL
ncbi:hypothetical protein GCM10022409_14570 [Hymenobacter glaciei]|uniref:Macroglobulin domain-containing protein n=2 Tax=Hymenobacter glaciei TaxID=877209 RepID=A0ABP7TUF6_9BACT